MADTDIKHLSREALEFAPGLLAIQESPPAKWPRAIVLVISLLLVSLLVWAFLGKLDVVASANGRLVPKTYLKIVQPSEAGIVQDILVKEGERVAKGQVLMRMDAKIVDADLRTMRTELAASKLQLRRIDAELADLPLRAEADDPTDLFARVESQYRAHHQAYLDRLEQNRAALQKARFDLAAAEEILDKLQQVAPMYQEEAEAMKHLAEQGHVSGMAAAEKQREAVESAQDLRAQFATVAGLKATIASTTKQLAQITSNYYSDLQNERIEAELHYRKLREELAKFDYRANLLVLRAPQDGVVKDIATHTPGTVVSPGAVLLSLVPHNEPLQAEVMLQNRDVGFVYKGQRAKVKLAPYPFQKYGMLEGKVSYIGPDVASVEDVSQSSPGNTHQTAEPFYKALVELESQVLVADHQPLALFPGMQVAAEIHLGERTVMEYLLSPVRKAWKEAGRER